MLEYYAIYSPRIKEIVGVTTDWESLTDCDDCQFIEISEQEFSDENMWNKSSILQRQKFKVILEKRLVKAE